MNAIYEALASLWSYGITGLILPPLALIGFTMIFWMIPKIIQNCGLNLNYLSLVFKEGGEFFVLSCIILVGLWGINVILNELIKVQLWVQFGIVFLASAFLTFARVEYKLRNREVSPTSR